MNSRGLTGYERACAALNRDMTLARKKYGPRVTLKVVHQPCDATLADTDTTLLVFHTIDWSPLTVFGPLHEIRLAGTSLKTELNAVIMVSG